MLALALRFRTFREFARQKRQGWQTPPGLRIRMLLRPQPWQLILFARGFLPQKTAPLLLDVGANTGAWAESFLRLIPADLMAFEPDKRAFRQLEQRFRAKEKQSRTRGETVLFNQAVSSREGSALFHQCRDSRFSSFHFYEENLGFAPDEAGLEDSAPVETVLLDSLAAHPLVRKAEFIILKIDVQGHERHALEGAQRLLPRAGMILLEAPFLSENGSGNELARLSAFLFAYEFYPVYFCFPGLGRTSLPLEHDIIFVNQGLLDSSSCFA